MSPNDFVDLSFYLNRIAQLIDASGDICDSIRKLAERTLPVACHLYKHVATRAPTDEEVERLCQRRGITAEELIEMAVSREDKDLSPEALARKAMLFATCKLLRELTAPSTSLDVAGTVTRLRKLAGELKEEATIFRKEYDPWSEGPKAETGQRWTLEAFKMLNIEPDPQDHFMYEKPGVQIQMAMDYAEEAAKRELRDRPEYAGFDDKERAEHVEDAVNGAAEIFFRAVLCDLQDWTEEHGDELNDIPKGGGSFYQRLKGLARDVQRIAENLPNTTVFRKILATQVEEAFDQEIRTWASGDDYPKSPGKYEMNTREIKSYMDTIITYCNRQLAAPPPAPPTPTPTQPETQPPSSPDGRAQEEEPPPPDMRIADGRRERPPKLWYSSGDENDGEWIGPFTQKELAEAIVADRRAVKGLLGPTGLIQRSREQWMVRVDNLMTVGWSKGLRRILEARAKKKAG